VGDDVADSAPRDVAVRDGSRDVLVYRINGPFFFGAAATVTSALSRTGTAPKVYVLDFEMVPFVDSTAAVALEQFVAKAKAGGSRVVIAAARPGPRGTLEQLGLGEPFIGYATTVDAALNALRAGG
jgi:sulfate permease, SulP family